MPESSDPDVNLYAAPGESEPAVMSPQPAKTWESTNATGPVAAIVSLFAGLFAAMVVFFLTMLVMCAGIVPATDGIRLGLVIGCSTFPAIVAGAVAIRMVSRHLESLRNQDRP